MNVTIGMLGLIYFLALFFWVRYLYYRSLRTAEARAVMYKRLAAAITYIPLGLQAIFLFCFAFFQLLPLIDTTGEFFHQFIFQGNRKKIPDLFALRIIFIGSMIIAINYLLLREAGLLKDKGAALACKMMLFIVNLFWLKVLVQNCVDSFQYTKAVRAIINYNNNYLWLMSVVLAAVYGFSGSQAGAIGRNKKYIALTSRMIWVYCTVLLVISIPRVIYLLVSS
ncbi:MAG: hypothetical protein JNM19_18910 [Chitinophagaceae bacterium]|nr:hypothetical protein [Chitinophagaceae bacterium]